MCIQCHFYLRQYMYANISGFESSTALQSTQIWYLNSFMKSRIALQTSKYFYAYQKYSLLVYVNKTILCYKETYYLFLQHMCSASLSVRGPISVQAPQQSLQNWHVTTQSKLFMQPKPLDTRAEQESLKNKCSNTILEPILKCSLANSTR